MPDKIGSSQGTIKLYDVNRSKPLSESVYQSSDGRITLAQPQIKRQVPCDSATGFLQPDGSCSDNGLNRANACALPVRLADMKCATATSCSATVYSVIPAVTHYYVADYVTDCSAGWGWSYCHNYALQFWTEPSKTTSKVTTYADQSTQQRFRLADGTIASDNYLACSGQSNTPSYTSGQIGVQLSKTVGSNAIGSNEFNPCCAPNCLPTNDWSEIGNSVDAWCNWIPTTQPPTTEPPTTQASTTQSEVPTEPPTNETLNSTSIDSLPSTTPAFANVVSVGVLPSSSQEIQQTRATLLPSVAPTTPAENGLALLGLLAIAPVGLGIVAAGVGAYGIYKWCYPDKEEEDTEATPSLKEEYENDAEKMPTQDNWLSFASIAHWFTRRSEVGPVTYDVKNEVVQLEKVEKHVNELVNEIETQTKETV